MKKNLLLVYSDEDGMRFLHYDSVSEARLKLQSLFEDQAPEEYRDSELSCFEDWIPPREDIYLTSEEIYALQMRNRYFQKQSLALEEDDAVLTDDTAYLRKNRFGEVFNARIIEIPA